MIQMISQACNLDKGNVVFLMDKTKVVPHLSLTRWYCRMRYGLAISAHHVSDVVKLPSGEEVPYGSVITD